MKVITNIVFGMLGLMAVAVIPSHIVAQERIIIVLDSSGSMAAKIDGTRKINVARSAIRSLIKKLPANTQLGLIAYGHNRKGDCNDIETIYPVGKPDRSKIMRAVESLRPLGNTPLGDAVRWAAEQLKYTEQKATVILVSDGKENCGVNPCALGADLKRQGIDFRTHVIGFALRKGQDTGLRCLAKNTGGLFVAAKDAPSLTKALRTTVRVSAKPAAEPKPKPVAVAEGLRIDVFVKEGGPVWKKDVAFKIFGQPQGLSKKRPRVANVWRKRSGYIFKGLKPGKYVLETVLPDHRHIVKRQDIEITAAPAQRAAVVLNIGQVRLSYSLKESGPPLSWQVGWSVLEPKQDFSGKRRKIAGFWRKKSGNVFWLPSGTWRVDGLLADARYMTVRKEIKVEPGSAEAHSFNFNGGMVRFDATLSSDDKAYTGDLGWKVLSKTKDFSGKQRQVANFWRKRSGKIFILPAGDWLVRGELADHRHVAISKSIKVEPGSQVRHGFDFQAGRIRFDVTVNGKPSSDQVGISVYKPGLSLDGKRQRIANFWRKRSGHITILPKGKYVVDGLLADQRTTKGQTTIDVRAGEEKAVQIDLKKN